MAEKYFYHSFPRSPFGPNPKWPSDLGCIENGISILESISEYGLLITPESWVLPVELTNSGLESEEIPIFQKRVCFTAIAPVDLARHAECFGSFSLEFDLSLLRRMGAMPVMYLATTIGGKTDFGGCSISLLHRLKEIHSLLKRLDMLKQICSNNRYPGPLRLKIGSSDEEFSIRSSTDGVQDIISILEHGIRDVNTLKASIDALSGLMYPSEYSDEELLEYFQEKEWRITNGFIHSSTGEGLCHELSSRHKKKLKLINPDYFNSIINMKSSSGPIIDYCSVISEFDGQSIIDLCSRIVVPGIVLEKVKTMLPKQAVKIIALESMTYE